MIELPPEQTEGMDDMLHYVEDQDLSAALADGVVQARIWWLR